MYIKFHPALQAFEGGGTHLHKNLSWPDPPTLSLYTKRDLIYYDELESGSKPGFSG